jgi:hypothetical protein
MAAWMWRFVVRNWRQTTSGPASPACPRPQRAALARALATPSAAPPSRMRKKCLRAEGRGFNPAVTRVRSSGVSTPEVRRWVFQHAARRSDLQVRQKTDCATRIPLAGFFSVGAGSAARQPWRNPSRATPGQPLTYPEIRRATAFLIATFLQTGIALTRCKQRTALNSNRYTLAPSESWSRSPLSSFQSRFSHAD